MNRKTTELLAVNAVKDSILLTDILHPSVSENDKGLSWDGFIEVYKTPNKERKDNLLGRIPTQVKGTENSNHTKSITFPVETSDLRNYLHDKGVIYFVVRIHKADSSKRTIYYAPLTPVKIKQYLNKAEKQKSKTIRLKEFPSTKEEKTEIVVNFLQECKKQLSYVDTGFIPMEDVVSAKYDYKIQYTAYGEQAKDPISALLGKETYAYVTIPNGNALIPVDTPLTITAVRCRINDEIRVGDKCYYSDYERIIDKENISVMIGDGLTLSFEHGGNTEVKVNITSSRFVRKATKDMQFLVDALDYGGLNIGSAKLSLDSFASSDPDFHTVIRSRLLKFKRLSELLTILNVDDDLDISQLTSEEERNINTLIDALVHKKNIPNIKTNTATSVLDLKLSNINLKLIIIKNEDGTYTIQDFFNSPVAVSYRDEHGNHLVTSPYSALQKEGYEIVSNIHYDKILDSYRERISQNPNIFYRANIDMLQMLLAYDETANPKCFAAVKNLAEWILADGEIMGYNIRQLNYLQVLKRERSLSDNEIGQLCDIAESANATVFEKVGAYLLLYNQTAAKFHFNKLTKDEQTEFKKYPIAKFCAF